MNSYLLYVYRLIALFLPETRFFALKVSILRLAGVKIGKNVRVCSSVRIIGNGKFSIGDDTWIGPETFISSSFPAEVKIGKNVDIAPKVYIGTGSHEIDMVGLHSAGKGVNSTIEIDDGVWICAGAIILPGVRIGKKSIIGAGSVVIRNIPDFLLGVGNPCRIAKDYRVNPSSRN